jgi:RNA polymerase-binding transcription factor
VASPAKKPTPAKKSTPVRKPAAAKKAAPEKAPAKAATAAKPAPVKAAPPAAAKPAKPRKSPLNEKELEAIKAELLEQRALFEKEYKDLEQGSFNTSQSELSGEVSFDEEYADAGTFTFERERDLSLSNNIQDLMDKVKIALRKIEDGSYGICERCGRPIDKARLKALPYSVLCITCKQQEERFR